MAHEDTIKAFKQGYEKWRIEESPLKGNGSDIFWYPNIPSAVSEAVVNNIDSLSPALFISKEEQLLYMKDTSFWKNRKCGLIITDMKIEWYNLNGAEELELIFWEDIDCVEYDADKLCFIRHKGLGSNGSLAVNNFSKGLSDSDVKKYGPILAEMFTNVANTQRLSLEELDERKSQYESMSHSDDVDEDLLAFEREFARLEEEEEKEVEANVGEWIRAREEMGDTDKTEEIAGWYSKKGESSKALQILEEDIDKIERNRQKSKYEDFPLEKLYHKKFEIQEKIGELNEARKAGMYVINHSEDLTLNVAREDFARVEINFLNHFYDTPYEKRRLILLVDKYPDMPQNKMVVLHIEHLPKLHFPVGHPVVNQLYVGHPLIAEKYIPFEHYALELLEERLREYCMVMQCLGATEIRIEAVNSKNESNEIHKNRKIYGSVEREAVSVSGNYEGDTQSSLLEAINQSMQLHQTFQPNSMPKLPENMVWYEHELSWQRTYEQRMQGSLLEHEERMETSKSQVVKNSELTDISAELKILMNNVNARWTESIESMFETQENAILSIKVKFAPLESLQGEVEPIPTKIEADQKEVNSRKEEYTSDEEEYVEELKACMEESSEISASERRLLDKLRAKLGISEERAAELEASLQQPQLSEEEEEYMEEVKACLEESSEISASARRLLNKLREKLGISEERTIEIENTCNHLR